MAGNINDPYDRLLNTYRNISIQCLESCVPTLRKTKTRRGEILCAEYCIAHEMQLLRKSVLTKLPQTTKKQEST